MKNAYTIDKNRRAYKNAFEKIKKSSSENIIKARQNVDLDLQKVTSILKSKILILKSVTNILIKSVLIGKKLGLDIEKRAQSSKSCRDLEKVLMIA